MAKKEADERKLFAFLAIFLGIIGFIIALAVKKKDKYVMFYAKQSLVLTILAVFIWIFQGILFSMFLFGAFRFMWLMNLLWLGFLVLWVFGIIYSFSGEEKDIPIIGKFARMIPL